MQKFTNKNQIEDWLSPMTYQAFWKAIAPYELTLQPRDHCDAQIESGAVSREVVLDVLKGMAVLELGQRHGLTYQRAHPAIRLVHSNRS